MASLRWPWRRRLSPDAAIAKSALEYLAVRDKLLRLAGGDEGAAPVIARFLAKVDALCANPTRPENVAELHAATEAVKHEIEGLPR